MNTSQQLTDLDLKLINFITFTTERDLLGREDSVDDMNITKAVEDMVNTFDYSNKNFCLTLPNKDIEWKILNGSVVNSYLNVMADAISKIYEPYEFPIFQEIVLSLFAELAKHTVHLADEKDIVLLYHFDGETFYITNDVVKNLVAIKISGSNINSGYSFDSNYQLVDQLVEATTTDRYFILRDAIENRDLALLNWYNHLFPGAINNYLSNEYFAKFDKHLESMRDKENWLVIANELTLFEEPCSDIVFLGPFVIPVDASGTLHYYDIKTATQLNLATVAFSINASQCGYHKYLQELYSNHDKTKRCIVMIREENAA